MADFDGAHYFMKDSMEIAIFNGIKEMNASDAYLKMIISGGDVLNRYFIGPQIFLTHDFDIKLTADKRVDLTRENVRAMYKYAEEIAQTFERTLNEFYLQNKQRMDAVLARRYGVKMAKKRDTKKYFNYFHMEEAQAHFPIRSRLKTLDDTQQDVD